MLRYVKNKLQPKIFEVGFVVAAEFDYLCI